MSQTSTATPIRQVTRALRFVRATLTAVVPNLPAHSGPFTIEAWIRPASVERGVTIFGEPWLTPPGRVLKAGRYDDISRYLRNNALGSIDVPPGFRAVFFDEERCRGKARTIDGLVTEAKLDLVPRSLIVIDMRRRGQDTVVLFDSARQTGTGCALELGQYPDCTAAGLPNPIKSLLIPPGLEVVLFKKPGMDGASLALRKDIDDLDDWVEKTLMTTGDLGKWAEETRSLAIHGALSPGLDKVPDTGEANERRRVQVFDNGTGAGLVLEIVPPLVASREREEQFAGVKVTQGDWHHLAVTWDGRVRRSFLDGRMVSEEPTAAPAKLDGAWSMKDYHGDIALIVARSVAREARSLAAGRFELPAPNDPTLLGIHVDKATSPVQYPDIIKWNLDKQDFPVSVTLPVSPMTTGLGQQLLARARAHNDARITEARAKAEAERAKAEAQAGARVREAHAQAVVKTAFGQLDRIDFIQGGTPRSLLRGGEVRSQPSLSLEGWLNGFACVPDGKRIVILQGGRVTVYDRNTGARIDELPRLGITSRDMPVRVFKQGNGYDVIVTVVGTPQVIALDGGSARAWKELPGASNRMHLPEGWSDAWANATPEEKIESLAQHFPPLNGRDRYQAAMPFRSPQGRWNAAVVRTAVRGGREIYEVGVLDLEDKRLVRILETASAEFQIGDCALRLSPDGKSLALALADLRGFYRMERWHVETGEHLGVLSFPSAYFFDIDWDRHCVLHGRLEGTFVASIPFEQTTVWSDVAAAALPGPKDSPKPPAFTTFAARRFPDGAVGRLGGDWLVTGRAPIHALVADPSGPDDSRRFLYWIEGAGALCRARMDGQGGVTTLADRLPPGADGEWDLTIDENRQRLYWTNGREIWSGEVAGVRLADLQMIVPRAISPRPIAVDVDDESGAVFWVDAELEAVRRANESGGDVRTLYPAPRPRNALAFDAGSRRLYWNAELREQREAAVIDDPGLFCWLQDLGEGPPRQHIPVLEDTTLLGATWQPAQNVPNDGPAAALAGRKALTFAGDGGHVDLGALYIDFREGVTVEACVRFDELKPWTRLVELCNGPEGDNVFCAVDGNGKSLCLGVSPAAGGAVAVVRDDKTELQAGRWLQLAITVTPDRGVRFFLDGKLAHSATLPRLPRAVVRTKCAIGQSAHAQDPAPRMQLALLRLWNLALTDEQIKAHVGRLAGPALALRPYHRSFLERRDERPMLWSGAPDGDDPAFPIATLAVDRGFALQGTGVAAHVALVAALRKKQEEQAKAEIELSRARRDAEARRAAAEAGKAQSLARHHQLIADKTAWGNRQRANVRARLETTKAVQQQRVEAAKRGSEAKEQQAREHAQAMREQGHRDHDDRVQKAKDRLADARRQRDEIKRK